MSPSPAPAASRLDRKLGRNGSSTSIRNGENSAAAQAIPNPKHIPWLETGEKANRAYLKARQEAIKHGGLRNKFLQRFVPIQQYCLAPRSWDYTDIYIVLRKPGTVTMHVLRRRSAYAARARTIS